MITPIDIREYTDKIAREYERLPAGPQKEELWKKIEKIAEKLFPSTDIEQLGDSE